MPGEQSVAWSFGGAVDANLRNEIRSIIGDWEPVSPELWIDQSDGEELTTAELADRYSIPPKLIASLQGVGPERFNKLVDQIDCHLIEAQRLLVIPTASSDDEVVSLSGIYRQRRSRQSTLAI